MRHTELLLRALKRCAVGFLVFLTLAQTAVFAQTTTTKRGVQVRPRDDQKLYAGSYALVIGVSDYAAGWDDLPGVAGDVTAVETALKAQGFEVRKTLNPKKSELTQQIQQFIDDYGFDYQNRLLIYYAGHGHTDTLADGRSFGYIVPSDAPLPGTDKIGFERKAIDMRQIENFAEQIRAKHAFFVFDSCFSGKLLSRSDIRVPPYVLDEVARPVRQFITAGAANQEVPDESVFRKLFVRALAGDADEDRDGYILGSELAKFLKREVTAHSNRTQTPQYGKILNLDLNQGDFVFVSPRGNSQNAANNQTQNQTQNQTANTVAPPVNNAQPALEIETQFWARIEKSRDADDFGDYLEEYPKGRFAPLARQRLRELKRQGASTNQNSSNQTANNQTTNNQTPIVQNSGGDSSANSANGKNPPVNSANSGNASGAPKPVYGLALGRTTYQGTAKFNSGLTIPFTSINEITEIQGTWAIAEAVAFIPPNLKSLPADEQAKAIANLTQVSAVTVDKKNFLPIIRQYRYADTNYELRYENNRISGEITAAGKTKKINTQVGSPLMGDSSLEVLATLPLEIGYSTTLFGFEAETEKVKTYRLRVTGVERISVPAGAFDAYKVSITTDDGDTQIWFDKSSRKLVKMIVYSNENGGITITSELCDCR